jgi:LPS-assembly protein
LSYKTNLTSLTRQEAEFQAINQNANTQSLCTSGNSSAVLNPSNCILRGVAGTYTRASGEVDWRRTFVTDSGQMITPFLSARADGASVDVLNQSGVSNFIGTGMTDPVRAMPAAGVEYRYPFIDAQPWGTQTIQPIAQLILRPNEAQIGKFPNEDAQSVVFSTANLFALDKFSGWDRDEGGGRLNAGFQYTAQFNRAGSLDVIFGQSYQLFGLNSYAVADPSNTGLESGLDKTISDYVGSVTYQPNQIYAFTASGRFDEATFAPQRLELESRANFDRWTLQLLYGDYAAQPDIGYLTRREELLAGAQFKITQNWLLLGSARYNLAVGEFDQTRVGIGYIDDCFMLSLNYLTYYTYTGVEGTTFLGSSSSSGAGTPFLNSTIMLQFSLRTLGPDFFPSIAAAY